MAVGLIDKVTVSVIGDDAEDFAFSRWASMTLSSSIGGLSEASFELGDDTGYDRLEELVQLGSVVVVMINDRPRLAGRIECRNSAMDATKSSTQRFVVRTRLSDAMVASAPQGLQLKRASIKDFVLACYEAIELNESHFDFRGDVSRDLLTGRATRGGRTPPNLEPLKEEQAKVNPPETVFAAVDRHLRRHGLMHWDGADGRIIVASPDDTQDPVANLRSFRAPNGQYNNVRSAEREQSVAQAPTTLGVFGLGGGRDFSRTRFRALITNEDLTARGFSRRACIIDEAIKTQALADARARREYATRSRGLERINVTVDGLSYREGSELLPWSPDTVIDCVLEQLGGALGAYYCERVEMSENASEGHQSRLSLVPRGVWVL